MCQNKLSSDVYFNMLSFGFTIDFRMSGGQGSSGVGGIVSGGRRLVAQQSTVWTRRQQAVCVRRAIKTYGSKDAPNVILDNLNMTVPKGCM